MSSKQHSSSATQASGTAPSTYPATLDEARKTAKSARLTAIAKSLSQATTGTDIKQWERAQTQALYQMFPHLNPDSFESRYFMNDGTTVANTTADDTTVGENAK
jgi:hypothetical protein